VIKEQSRPMHVRGSRPLAELDVPGPKNREATSTGPSKPSKPSFVGFEGTGLGGSPNIESAEQVRHELAVPCRGVSWGQWKADALNRLFEQQGVTGQPGRITAQAVRHGREES
jgi:hypothetical protein